MEALEVQTVFFIKVISFGSTSHHILHVLDEFQMHLLCICLTVSACSVLGHKLDFTAGGTSILDLVPGPHTQHTLSPNYDHFLLPSSVKKRKNPALLLKAKSRKYTCDTKIDFKE